MSVKHVIAAILHAITPHHHAPRTAFYGNSLSIMLHVPKHYHVSKLTVAQRERALALTMYGEARSLGPSGMRAVGFVILNRVRAGQAKFGDYHINNVVWARKQFSCWNGRDPNRTLLGHIGRTHDKLDRLRWVQAKQIAHRLIGETAGRDPTNGATLYHTRSIKPFWVASVRHTAMIGRRVFSKTIITRQTAVIGSHVFYKIVVVRHEYTRKV